MRQICEDSWINIQKKKNRASIYTKKLINKNINNPTHLAPDTAKSSCGSRWVYCSRPTAGWWISAPGVVLQHKIGEKKLYIYFFFFIATIKKSEFFSIFEKSRKIKTDFRISRSYRKFSLSLTLGAGARSMPVGTITISSRLPYRPAALPSRFFFFRAHPTTNLYNAFFPRSR